MKRCRLLLLIGLFVLRPGAASAQIGYIWEWIEQMSGPGPWNAHSLELRLLCPKQMNLGALTEKPIYVREPLCWDDDARVDIKGHLSLRAGFAYTNGLFSDNQAPLFADDPTDTRRIWAVKVEPLLLARVGPWLDAGGGIGVMWFRGPGFSTFPRLVTTPVSLVITPGAVFRPDTQNSRWIKIRYEMYYFPKGFNGRDNFNNLSTAYLTRSEWAHSVGLMIDYSQ